MVCEGDGIRAHVRAPDLSPGDFLVLTDIITVWLTTHSLTQTSPPRQLYSLHPTRSTTSWDTNPGKYKANHVSITSTLTRFLSPAPSTTEESFSTRPPSCIMPASERATDAG